MDRANIASSVRFDNMPMDRHGMEDGHPQQGPGQWNGGRVNGAPRPMTTDRNLPPPPAIMQPYAPGPPNQRSYAPQNPSTGYAPMQMAASALRTVDNNRIQPPMSGYGPHHLHITQDQVIIRNKIQ
jgi:hypothetical protein